MSKVLRWWKSGLSPWVKLIYLVLLVNAVPAFLSLMLVPTLTRILFVWTILPAASARLLGVMYGNALLLVVVGICQSSWARARVTVVVITLFAFAATLVTLFNLGPFLQHPWYHLAYWLTIYLILFFTAPLVLFFQERAHGGRLPVVIPLSPLARGLAATGALAAGLTGLGLFINPLFVSAFWPWNLTVLVGRILAVWFTSLALAYLWTLWDGDWLRTRPIFWQMLPTGLLLALIPLLHSSDLRRGATWPLVLYLVLALCFAAAALVVLLTEQRGRQTVEAGRGKT